MFMLHGRLAAQAGKRDQLLAILSEGAQNEQMAGCGCTWSLSTGPMTMASG